MKKQDSCNRTAGENPGTIILYMICIFGRIYRERQKQTSRLPWEIERPGAHTG